MSPELDARRVQRLLDGLGLAPDDPIFVAHASTCAVWRAGTVAGPIAFRVLAPRPGKPDDLDADIAIRRLLSASGTPVAQPLADHRERPDLAFAPHRPAWVVDRWIDGEPADAATADAATADAVWRDLGALLATLHALPVDGHGRPIFTCGVLVGRRGDGDAGIRDRFEAPWPFSGRPLAEHPVAAAAPDLAARLARLEPAIRAAAAARPAIIHGDLNGANIRHADGRLRGLIDFADATVLAPAWDFASLRHFHGAAAVDRALAGYTSKPAEAAGLADDARLLALTIALHHLSRARTLGLPQRRATALDRLRRGLDASEAG